METVGGPDAKKARWSPTSFGAANGANGLAANASASANRDAFANYGYGPQAGMAQNGFANSSPSNGFNGNPLYSTPTLSVNTAVATNGMPGQMSPNTAGPYTPQNQQPPSANPNSAHPYNFNGYNMLGMGLPSMGVLGGFGYNGQMAANFAQVRSVSSLAWSLSPHFSSVYALSARDFLFSSLARNHNDLALDICFTPLFIASIPRRCRVSWRDKSPGHGSPPSRRGCSQRR